jgi:hypothetical protein
MKIVRVHFESMPGSPYSQSAMVQVPKHDRESAQDYDDRTWREHCTTDAAGNVQIPNIAFPQSLVDAAHLLGMKVPGRRTGFKAFFTQAVVCNENVAIHNGSGPWTKADAEMIIINAHANGQRGSGKRVPRKYPMFPRYHGVAAFTVLDDVITDDVFEQHFKYAGVFVGIGRWSPKVGGLNGRYRPTRFDWEAFELT